MCHKISSIYELHYFLCCSNMRSPFICSPATFIKITVWVCGLHVNFPGALKYPIFFRKLWSSTRFFFHLDLNFSSDGGSLYATQSPSSRCCSQPRWTVWALDFMNVQFSSMGYTNLYLPQLNNSSIGTRYNVQIPHFISDRRNS